MRADLVNFRSGKLIVTSFAFINKNLNLCEVSDAL